MVADKPKSGLSEKFDVVAVYDLEKGKPQALTDYITVLHMMKEGERDRFFMADIKSVCSDEYIAEAQGALEFLDGSSKYGWRMSIVQATHEGVPTYMPLLEDTRTNKLLVVGPQGVGGADKWPELTYVNAELYNRKKAVEQIDEFLIAGARFRGEQGEIDHNEARDLVENLVRALMVMATPRNLLIGNMVPPATTLGKCFALVADGEADVGAYVVAREKPAAAAKAPAPGKPA